MRGPIRTGVVVLKHVQTVRKGGREYRYLRLPGQPRMDRDNRAQSRRCAVNRSKCALLQVNGLGRAL